MRSRMLHRLGEQRMQPDLGDALVTKRADGTFAIAVWNYAASGRKRARKQVHIALEGWTGSAAISRRNGGCRSWFGVVGVARHGQSRVSDARAVRTAAQSRVGDTKNWIGPTFTLPAHGLALVEVKP